MTEGESLGKARAQLGRRLRMFRAEAGLTQEELSTRSGLHVTYISGIERGRRNPSVATLLGLAAALGIGPEAFFASPPDSPQTK